MPTVGIQLFNGTPVPMLTTALVDVIVPSSTTTTIASIGGNLTPVSSVGAGAYQVMIWGGVAIDIGATPPTAFNITYAHTPGAALATITLNASALTANAHIYLPVSFITDIGTALWFSGTTTPMLQCTATGQQVTVRLNGTALGISLAPAS